jgi:hypothetical protein
VESSGREASDGWESQQSIRVRDPKSVDTWGQFSSGRGQNTKAKGLAQGRGILLTSPRF